MSSENQESQYRKLGEFETAVQFGTRKETGKWELNAELITALISFAELRNKFARQSLRLIDFDGASRITEAINCL